MAHEPSSYGFVVFCPAVASVEPLVPIVPMAYAKSDLTKLHRSQKRGSYDKQLVHEILDQGVVAHVVAWQMLTDGGAVLRWGSRERLCLFGKPSYEAVNSMVLRGIGIGWLDRMRCGVG